MSSLRTITICTLALATTVVGCARTPAVTSMTAPAPGAAVGQRHHARQPPATTASA